MDLLIALIVSFLLLLFSVFKGYFIAYPLLLSLSLFVMLLRRRGYAFKALFDMGVASSKKSIAVLQILLLIGAVTAIWMAAGTVPTVVYYGIQFISPKYFILASFGLTSLISLLLGTSFGTVSTIGIALMIMAKGSGVDSHLIAGAIIAGAYFGDRCSPMSSSAHLIATITQTKLYTNIKNMWKTALMPLAISVLIYCVLSILNPVKIADQSFLVELTNVFNMSWVNLLPAIAILGLSILQIDVKLSMLISILVSMAIALVNQHYPWMELLKFMILGFSLDQATPLQSIVLGGGVLSMVKVSIVVIISTAFVGIFVETRVLNHIERLLDQVQSRQGCFLSTCAVGITTAAFGCTQTIAILLTQQLVEQKYKENEKGNYKLALDLENTVVVLAPLIPWNIAGLVPATILSTDSGFIPYAVYLYLVPLLNLIYIRLSHPPRLKLCN